MHFPLPLPAVVKGSDSGTFVGTDIAPDGSSVDISRIDGGGCGGKYPSMGLAENVGDNTCDDDTGVGDWIGAGIGDAFEAVAGK